MTHDKDFGLQNLIVPLLHKLLFEDAASALQVVQGFNTDPAVHGILVQLPLPKHINVQRILDAVSFEKDVDGFHPQNIGCLAMRTRDPLFICCTPKVCTLPMRHISCPVTCQTSNLLVWHHMTPILHVQSSVVTCTSTQLMQLLSSIPCLHMCRVA